MKRLFALIIICLSLVSVPTLAQQNRDLVAAIGSAHRSPANKARDVDRHPYETLTFFGIQKDSTVVEIWPGTGWYTEILAPYLKENGRLIVATYDRSDNPPEQYMRAAVIAFDEFLASRPDLYSEVDVTEQVTGKVSRIAEPGSVDAILDFRNAHNWIPAGAENIIKAWYAALRPGGSVGIVDHRRDADAPFLPDSGYIHEQQLIDLMQDNGFTLVGRSQINANPRDTKDYPGGVWTLPPNLSGVAESERARFLEIGESDRMTLKFVKNAK